MKPLTLSLDLKKQYIQRVGETLVTDHGKQKNYSPDQVNQASSQVIAASIEFLSVDWHCWAMCVYSIAADFNAYHTSIGEICDYASMKSEMTSALTDGVSDSWFDADMSWLEWPDIDLSSIFDVFD